MKWRKIKGEITDQFDPVMDEMLGALRRSTIEAEGSDNFEEAFLSRWRRAKEARPVFFWSPVLVGAAVTAFALLALLQIITYVPNDAVSPENMEVSLPASERPIFGNSEIITTP